jgi:hypothetical protein
MLKFGLLLIALVLAVHPSSQAQIVRQLSDVKQVRFSFSPSGIDDAAEVDW